MKSKKSLAITTMVLGVILALLAMGDWDYSISKAIVNKHSIFGEFFHLFGEVPAYLGAFIGVCILFGGRNKDVQW